MRGVLYAGLVEKSRVSAVQDGAGASTSKLELEDDLRARVRKLEEELRALDDKVGATVDAACCHRSYSTDLTAARPT
jgi:hypothetical protein